MSKIAADTLRAATLGVEAPMVNAVRGSSKNWATLNGTGTIALRESLGISSITDVGTGSYEINYTTAMSSVGHFVNGSAYGTASGFPGAASTQQRFCRAVPKSVSAAQVLLINADAGTLDTDTPYIGAGAFGDLA